MMKIDNYTVAKSTWNLEKRLKIITYAQIALPYYRSTTHPSVIAELWMIPLRRFSNDDMKLFRQVDEYVRYALSDADLPDWYREGDVPKDW